MSKMFSPDEIALLQQIRDEHSDYPQRALADKIFANWQSFPSHLAGRIRDSALPLRSYASIYGAIRRLDLKRCWNTKTSGLASV